MMMNPTQNYPEYEFTPEQDSVLTELSKKMRFVGAFAVILGILAIISAIGGFLPGGGGAAPALGRALDGVLWIFMGIWTRGAGASFRRIVDTRGSDMSNLMLALGDLRRLYTMFYVLVVVMIVLMILAFFGALAFGLMGHG